MNTRDTSNLFRTRQDLDKYRHTYWVSTKSKLLCWAPWGVNGFTETKEGQPSRRSPLLTLCKLDGKSIVPFYRHINWGPRRLDDMLMVITLFRLWFRMHFTIQIGHALPFCFLKCCLPGSSSCGQTFPSFFFSWHLWNKLSQRRNSHIAILPGTHIYIASGMRRKKIIFSISIKRSARWSSCLHFICSLSKDFHFLQQSPGVGEAGWLCDISTVHSIQDNVFLYLSLSSQMKELPLLASIPARSLKPREVKGLARGHIRG